MKKSKTIHNKILVARHFLKLSLDILSGFGVLMMTFIIQPFNRRIDVSGMFVFSKTTNQQSQSFSVEWLLKIPFSVSDRLPLMKK